MLRLTDKKMTSALFVVCLSLFTAIFSIFMGGQPTMWVGLELGAIFMFVLVPLLLYMRINLSYFFLIVLALILPLDITKAFTFFVGGEESIKYVSARDFAATMMVICYLFEVFLIQRNNKLHLNFIIIPFLLFFFWSQFSMLNAKKPHLTALHITTFIKWGLTFLTIANILNTKKKIYTIVGILLVLTCAQGAYVIAQKVTGSDLALLGQKTTELGRGIDFGAGVGSVRRPSGTLHHPNVLASFIVYAAPLVTIFFFRPFSIRMKIACGITFGSGLISLLLSYSRGGWICFALATTIIILYGLKKGLLKIKLLISLGLVGAIFAACLFPLWESFLYRITKSDNESTSTRIVMLEQAFMMAADKPFVGIGLSNYAEASFDYLPEKSLLLRTAPKGFIAHNKYAVIMAETGFVGLALYLWLLWQILVVAYKNIKIKDEDIQILSIVLFATYFSTLLGMHFDHYSDGTRNTLFWFFTGIILAVRNHFKHSSAIDTGQKILV